MELSDQDVAVEDLPRSMPPFFEENSLENNDSFIKNPIDSSVEESRVVNIEPDKTEDAESNEEEISFEDIVWNGPRIVPENKKKPSNKIKVWEAKRGSDLKNVLEKWAQEEDVPLIWNASESYVLDKNVFINGTFKNAAHILFSQGLKNPPKHIFLEEPSRELRVEDQ